MSTKLLKQDGFYRLNDNRIICVKTWSETNGFVMYRATSQPTDNHEPQPELQRMSLNEFYELNPTLI